MKGREPFKVSRFLAAVLLILGAVAGGYFTVQSWGSYQDLVIRPEITAEEAARRARNSDDVIPLFSVDEIFANLASTDSRVHSVGMKLEVELFSEDYRSLLEKSSGIIKDVVIESAEGQDYGNLSTVAGKLFYKELLIARINKAFHRAIVRDLHFSSFYLQ